MSSTPHTHTHAHTASGFTHTHRKQQQKKKIFRNLRRNFFEAAHSAPAGGSRCPSLSYPLSVSFSASSHCSFAQFSPLGSIQTLSTVTPKKKIFIKIIIIVKNNITHNRNNNNCCFPFLYCLSANEFQTNFFLFYILSACFVYCCCCCRTNVSDRQTERLRKDRGGRGRGADCGEGLLLVADCAVDNAVCSNKSNSFSHSAIFHFTSSIFIFSSSVFNSFFLLHDEEIVAK